MKLTAFKYGTTEITEKMAFQNGDETKIPISLLFFLIETDDKKILVDVGCDTMPGFPLFQFKKPVDVLEEYGMDRKDITDVVITHAHHDHIDALRYYTQANVYLHKDELGAAKKYMADCENVCLIDDEQVIADGVVFKYIGGHSKGSGIVLLETDGKTFVLCGDECYTKENLLYKKPTGCSVCIEKSEYFVEEYGKDSYVTYLFHDPDLVEEIGHKTLIE